MGINTSSNPESCVDVVVARMRFGLAGAAEACVGASVGAWVAGASVAIGALVTGAAVGVAAEPQAVNAMEKMSSRERRIFRVLIFIVFPFPYCDEFDFDSE